MTSPALALTADQHPQRALRHPLSPRVGWQKGPGWSCRAQAVGSAGLCLGCAASVALLAWCALGRRAAAGNGSGCLCPLLEECGSECGWAAPVHGVTGAVALGPPWPPQGGPCLPLQCGSSPRGARGLLLPALQRTRPSWPLADRPPLACVPRRLHMSHSRDLPIWGRRERPECRQTPLT